MFAKPEFNKQLLRDFPSRHATVQYIQAYFRSVLSVAGWLCLRLRSATPEVNSAVVDRSTPSGRRRRAAS